MSILLIILPIALFVGIIALIISIICTGMPKYRIVKTSQGYKIQKRLFWFIYDTYGYEGVTEYGAIRSGTIFYKIEEEAIKYLDEIRMEEKQRPKMKKKEVVYETD